MIDETEHGKNLAMGNTSGMGKPAEGTFPTTGGELTFTTSDQSKIRKDVPDTATQSPAHPADNMGVKDFGTT